LIKSKPTDPLDVVIDQYFEGIFKGQFLQTFTQQQNEPLLWTLINFYGRNTKDLDILHKKLRYFKGIKLY